ncbi:hypothetical protein ABVT39_022170 [Epinephelus coioides]
MAKADQPQRCVPVRSSDIGVQASTCSGDTGNRAESGLICVYVCERRGQSRGSWPVCRGRARRGCAQTAAASSLATKARSRHDAETRAPVACISNTTISGRLQCTRTQTQKPALI